jgi:2-polyprenyl-3-methyl-5-hydroxy-6-metoxy-1,4-benzoquinol methylase
MLNDEPEKKWNKIYATKDLSTYNPELTAAEVLQEHVWLLPKSGDAVDLACGLGSNAIFLAKHGLHTQGWDISQTVIEKLRAYCQEYTVSLAAEVRDIEKQPPEANSFDVINVSYYLERNICDAIIAALRPHGLLFYQTFIIEKVTEHGPSNLQYRLQANELLKLFSPLHILAYKEYGRVGDIKQGVRDVAMLVAQKR